MVFRRKGWPYMSVWTAPRAVHDMIFENRGEIDGARDKAEAMDRDRFRGPGPVPDPEPGTLRRRSAGGLGGAVLELPRSGGGAQPVSGAQVGDKVVPLGRAVGIKLFSDGVLVVGLSAVETDSGPSSPGRTCGLKAGDIITHINGQEVNTIEEVQDILGDEQGMP